MLSDSSLPETTAKQANANVVLADNRRDHCSAVLVPVDTLPGVPNDQCN
jgi:hypothetical protein